MYHGQGLASVSSTVHKLRNLQLLKLLLRCAFTCFHKCRLRNTVSLDHRLVRLVSLHLLLSPCRANTVCFQYITASDTIENVS